MSYDDHSRCHRCSGLYDGAACDRCPAAERATRNMEALRVRDEALATIAEAMGLDADDPLGVIVARVTAFRRMVMDYRAAQKAVPDARSAIRSKRATAASMRGCRRFYAAVVRRRADRRALDVLLKMMV